MAAKIVITIATLMYGVVALLADLNATHLLNSQWLPHARLHMAWLLGTSTSIAIIALYLIWVRSQVVMAATLGFAVVAGFWIAVSTLSLYGGSLSDPGGRDTSILGIEGNLFSIIVITLLLVIGVVVRDKSSDA